MAKKFLTSLLSLAFLTFVMFNNINTADAAGDKDCKDFSGDHKAVMEYWYSHHYTAENDPERLDGWGNKVDDGIPCEVSKDEYNAFLASKKADKSDKDDKASTSDDKATTSKDNTSDKTAANTSDDKSNTDSSSTSSDNDEGGSLPNTATHYPTMILVGAIIAFLGALLFFRKRAVN
ncbi:LPXTG-motif cell wall-anchored protein [Scopulibacillus darangshiensis]|uniref:LPXTG-motif cell wall-anchored protein n=1 Tax=Scopulibacillus darangshiensis TaxID=442528 RepID=A0A4V2SLV5_9BACL|nr:LPXTG cell wall anchor domain-containing protein [Scopulibacillus darangshiensis]TCP24906.1 LPXTG-motif cell wall-anchored protein [Scopulibacillus darangshiensis]